jgi:hypothetical protein
MIKKNVEGDANALEAFQCGQDRLDRREANPVGLPRKLLHNAPHSDILI